MAPQKPPEKKMLGENGFKYRPQYGVVALCDGEMEQRKVYGALTALGLKCRVVAV
jgi:hypothetical protein